MEITPCPYWGAGITNRAYLQLEPQHQDPKYLPGRNWTGLLLMEEREASRQVDADHLQAEGKMATQEKERRAAALQLQNE